MGRIKNTVIYTNFSPYENTGYILDYFKETYTTVIMFSYNFHVLKTKKEVNTITVFKNGRIIQKIKLFMFPLPENLVFLLLPFKSVLIFIEMLYYLLRLRKEMEGERKFFTVNAYIAWIGNILKKVKLVDTTTFWVWDYYPPHHENKVVVFMRWMYWHLDKWATTGSDNVVFLNKRLEKLRRKIGVIQNHRKYPMVGIGTKPQRGLHSSKSPRDIKLAFIGVIKKSQGLDLLFDIEKELLRKFKNISVEIIGDGPDLEYFKNRSKHSQIACIFHGLLSEDNKKEEQKIQRILSQCDIGIAMYKPEKSNVSYYGDPAKIKRYLGSGLPVITTNVFVFSKDIEKQKAGVVVRYGNAKEFLRGIGKIKSNYAIYRRNVIQLAKKYAYQTIYRDLI
jgi:glycosyltransferase involved in cell wall biosynthesis